MVLAQERALPAKNLKRITTYVEPDVYERLLARAKIENRSVSNMAATILTQSASETTEQQG